MAQMRNAKGDREHAQLHCLMAALGHRHEEWTIEARRERPDYVVRIRNDQLVGIELTEILPESHGEARAMHRRLGQKATAVIQEFLKSKGGLGAYVEGHIHTVPETQADIERHAEGLRAHLSKHGADLHRDRGVMKIPFADEFGGVSDIMRHDQLNEILSSNDGRGTPPPHRARRDEQELTSHIEACIAGKAEKAKQYDRTWPLWLALRNPSQRMLNVPPSVRETAQRAAAGLFERVILYNDPEGVVDIRPPLPRTLDLLGG